MKSQTGTNYDSLILRIRLSWATWTSLYVKWKAKYQESSQYHSKLRLLNHTTNTFIIIVDLLNFICYIMDIWFHSNVSSSPYLLHSMATRHREEEVWEKQEKYEKIERESKSRWLPMPRFGFSYTKTFSNENWKQQNDSEIVRNHQIILLCYICNSYENWNENEKAMNEVMTSMSREKRKVRYMTAAV